MHLMRSRVLICILPLLAATTAACGAERDTTGTSARASTAPTPTPTARQLDSLAGGSSVADFHFHYRTFDDFVSQSSVIFEGEVVSEERGAATTQNEVRDQTRVLQLRVKEVLSGFQPSNGAVRVDDFGWLQVRGQEERVDRPGGYLRVEVGDVGIFNVSTTDKKVYGFTNDQAVFLIHGDEVRDTDRPSPFVREAERLTADELRGRIRAVAATLGRSSK